MSYNGWSNETTWTVGEWVLNDEYLYEKAREIIFDADGDLEEAAIELEREIWNTLDSLIPDFDDLCRTDVDWLEIAEVLAE